MAVEVATHSGPFHADDVMAWALIRCFYDANATIVRTRDADRLARADIVVDVGAVYDPDTRRFDHHQSTYEGPLSSAGMVLRWLEAEGHVDSVLAEQLRSGLVNYLDDVDNGRVAPKPHVPCFPRIVEALNQPARAQEEFDAAFRVAGDIALRLLEGLVASHDRAREAEAAVLAAMTEAEREGRNVIFLDAYHRWKGVYFNHGGETHPTEFVLFPGTDGSWRIVAIPPKFGDFGQEALATRGLGGPH